MGGGSVGIMTRRMWNLLGSGTPTQRSPMTSRSIANTPPGESAPRTALVVGPLLRYVGRTEATVWVEVDATCEVEVLGQTAQTFEVRGHHYAVVALTGLDPGTVVDYTVRLDGAEVWPFPDETRPQSSIHTREGEHGARLVFGSC